MNRFFLISASIVIMTCISCQERAENKERQKKYFNELKRVPSPDKKVEAVLVQDNTGGATVGTSHLVFIVLPGEKINIEDEKFANLVADHCQDMDIEWKENKVLVVNYFKARIFDYCNFWHTRDLENFNYVVEVKLNCTSPGSQLSYFDKHTFSPMADAHNIGLKK